MPDGSPREVRRHSGTSLASSELLSQKAGAQVYKLGRVQAGRGRTWSPTVDWIQVLLEKQPRLLSETSAPECCAISSLDTKSVT